MKINAFGKKVSRQTAYEIIINDRLSDICHAGNTDSLVNLLKSSWKALDQWTDQELEDFISELDETNQPI